MLGASITRILQNRKIRKEVKHRKFGGASGKVLVIIENDDVEQFSGLLNLHDKLPFNKKEIEVVCCNSTSGLLQNVDVHSFSSEDISLSGTIKNEILERLLNQSYEFVISYYDANSLLGPLLAARARAQIKLGKTPDVFGIFDVEIRCDNLQVFEEEIIKYIKIIKK